MSLNGYRNRFSCFVGSSGVLGGGVGGSNCNYSVYTDGVETINVPFVECGTNIPDNTFFSFTDESAIIMQNGSNGNTVALTDYNAIILQNGVI